MPQVSIRVLVPKQVPAETYTRIGDFARYAELTDTVHKVVVHPAGPDGSLVSEWTVQFRNGLLCWTERDWFDPTALTIGFDQLTGDFASFAGTWSVQRAGSGSRIDFDARFDLGIPTLAAILDPIAESALRTNIAVILRGLLGEVVPLEQSRPGP
jgi:ribosome-associated toxin RatA of RatAB toxin-antitoxin module